MQVSGLFDDLVVELVDGGVHDNQGIEGLVDRGCTHFIVSDGSGQMPDVERPSTRIPAVLGRVISIYGDQEREQRLLRALASGTMVFMHLQTGLPSPTRTPSGAVEEKEARLQTKDFGVDERVQRALAQVRTDLDAFCDVEAWSLMQDAYWLAGAVVPRRRAVASLGTPTPGGGWAFEAVADELARPSDRYLRLLRASKERFLKPVRMLPGWVYPTVMALVGLALLAGVIALGFVLAPHGTVLYVAGAVLLVALVLYVKSGNLLSKVLYDVLVPVVAAVPLLFVAAAQLAAGRRWRAVGRAERLRKAPEGAELARPV
jgi:NTE family protein